jgi:hypothetical protein
MNRFIAAVVASAFAFGTVSTYAADAAKKDELTVEQRAEMRERAARMKQQGQQTTAPAQDKMHKKVDKNKRSDVKPHKHTKKVAKRSSKKSHRHA